MGSELFRVKVKVKLPLYLIKHHTMNLDGEVEVQLQAFLNLGTKWSEWLYSRSGHSASRE